MLIKDGRETPDIFTAVADEALPDAPVILPLKRFLAERETLLARPYPLGVRLETSESPEPLGADVHRLAAIVLHVPHFKDGRHFSGARLLRTRMGFTGELRITGHVLRDQVAFYARVGVDAFDVGQRLKPADVHAALHEISQVYQPSVDGRRTIRDIRAAEPPKRATAS